MENGSAPGRARRKPLGLHESDVLTVVLARFLSKFWVFAIVGTFLAVCVAVYAIARAAGTR